MPSLSIILSNAFVLGFRHGVDWDHLAAIGDIVGASSVGSGASSAATVSGARSLYPAIRQTRGDIRPEKRDQDWQLPEPN